LRDPVGPFPVTLTKPQRDLAQSGINQHVTLTAVTLLTSYDPRSVMGYCSEVNGRHHDDMWPPPRDLLGVEMMYRVPNRTYLVGCGDNCLYSGDGVVLRADGEITSEWTARGGVGISVKSGTFLGDFMPASALPAGSSNFAYTFTYGRQEVALPGAGVVTKDDGLHTALAAHLID
jgi:hypothetical protein